MKTSNVLFEKNLSFIRNKFPELYKTVIKCNQSHLNFRIIQGSFTTVSVEGLQLSSRHDPQYEAIHQSKNFQKSKVVTIYGIGLGYLPSVLIGMKDIKTINIKIMNLRLFLLTLSLKDQSDWIKDKKVNITLANADSQLLFPYFAIPPELSLADQSTSKMRHIISSDINYSVNSKKFQANNPFIINRIKENENTLAKDKHLNGLVNFGINREAFVIGSGPSLSNTIKTIKNGLKSKEPPVLICVDTATKFIFNSGIIPDFVISADKDITLSHPLVDSFSKTATSKLVYFPLVSPEIIAAWQGERYVAYSDSPIYKELRTKIIHKDLFTGGSVIHPATDLAIKIGCTEVTFFGVDFCFTEDCSHAGSSSTKLPNYDNNMPTDQLRRTVLNGYGKQAQTLDNFISYLVELERYIHFNPGVSFWNSSRLGAQISGCKLRKF